jgi:hypothetical protein
LDNGLVYSRFSRKILRSKFRYEPAAEAAMPHARGMIPWLRNRSQCEPGGITRSDAAMSFTT